MNILNKINDIYSSYVKNFEDKQQPWYRKFENKKHKNK